jgi:hypothetical protein
LSLLLPAGNCVEFDSRLLAPPLSVKVDVAVRRSTRGLTADEARA